MLRTKTCVGSVLSKSGSIQYRNSATTESNLTSVKADRLYPSMRVSEKSPVRFEKFLMSV